MTVKAETGYFHTKFMKNEVNLNPGQKILNYIECDLQRIPYRTITVVDNDTVSTFYPNKEIQTYHKDEINKADIKFPTGIGFELLLGKETHILWEE